MIMEKIFAGIDLGGTTAKLGLFKEDASLLRKWEIKTRKEDGGSHVIPDLAETIRDNIAAEGLPFEALAGVGLAVPGPIHKDGYLERCVNIGMENMNPVKDMSELLGGVFVKGGNDANVAALGEVWQGGGKGYSDVVVVTLGTGVGGGVIHNGKIVEGSKGMGGEIGHMCVNWEEDPENKCNCGSIGCVEYYASATGIARRARKILAECSEPSALRKVPADKISAKRVLDEAKAGDALATRCVEECMDFLSRMMALMTMAIDPDIFVIGGGVSKAGDYLLDVIEKHYAPKIFLSKEHAKVALAKLGNDAGIFGAAKMVMDALR